MLRKPLQKGKTESRRLTCAGLRRAQQVPSFKKVRYALLLNRRGRCVTLRRHGLAASTA